MSINRRNAVKLGTAATLGAFLPRYGISATDGNPAFEAEFDNTLTHLRQVFSDLGYSESRPLPIATGDNTFNGGLRHDFDQSALPTRAFVIQPLARVADIDEKARMDILPLFHEVGCHPEKGADGEDTTRLMLRVILEDFGLDPERIALVSVPQSIAVKPALAKFGLPFSKKVLLRDAAEALAARDASGFFFPNPNGEDFFVTMGVYYRIGDQNEASPTAYPPSNGWTEIGEIVIEGDTAPLGISLGAERLTLARTGLYPVWNERLAQLAAQTRQDAINGNVPPGLAEFE